MAAIIHMHLQYDALDGMCLLLFTVRSGHLEVVKYLIEVQECSTGYTDSSRRTPLHRACRLVLSL